MGHAAVAVAANRTRRDGQNLRRQRPSEEVQRIQGASPVSAQATQLAADATPARQGRYLWTDAHGVCNYISLARESGDASYLDRADALIDDVHATLGRDRAGRLLGHADAPLAGGLRIGKVADEDHPDGDGALLPFLFKRCRPRLTSVACACARALQGSICTI